MDVELSPFYSPRCLDSKHSPDPRAQLHHVLGEIARHIRDLPTIPADPSDAGRPWKEALDDQQAVVLPHKLCALIGCAWDGPTDDEPYKHVSEQHMHIFLWVQWVFFRLVFLQMNA